MEGWVDIHCHALPGVDDGAPDVDTSLAMLRTAVGEGLRQAVVTPHYSANAEPDQLRVHESVFSDLVSAVAAEGLPVELHLGVEMAFRFGLQEVAIDASARLAGGQYVLVDLPPGPLSPGLEQAFFALRTAGWRPILAHPERHRELARQPERIQRLRDQDLLLQVNAGSLVGKFGRRAMATAQLLVERGWADFIASDGHDLHKRPMTVRAAADRLLGLVGAERTRQLLCDNPACVMSGAAIEPYHPAVSGRRGGLGQWIQRRFAPSAATRG
ncbi:MAG: hypothetical protein HN712_21575 [Gemmatimonadetes bacterium]|nr:hypothetical protein [Gemmatimonadota bacterium]MBT6149939.1 hypothetical protein [Gemmatimonadota bacterium]MBT7862919.1 hypothetical protein [Gemmatimonadota bacterium]